MTSGTVLTGWSFNFTADAEQPQDGHGEGHRRTGDPLGFRNMGALPFPPRPF